MASPRQAGAEDVMDRRAGTYKERHLCAACKGKGEPHPSNQLDATGRLYRPVLR